MPATTLLLITCLLLVQRELGGAEAELRPGGGRRRSAVGRGGRRPGVRRVRRRCRQERVLVPLRGSHGTFVN